MLQWLAGAAMAATPTKTVMLGVDVDPASADPKSLVERVGRTELRRLQAVGIFGKAKAVRCGRGRWCVRLRILESVTRPLEPMLEAPGQLEIRPVDDDPDDQALDDALSTAEQAMPPDRFADDAALAEWLRGQGLVADPWTLKWMRRDGERVQPLLVGDEWIANADLSRTGGMASRLVLMPWQRAEVQVAVEQHQPVKLRAPPEFMSVDEVVLHLRGEAADRLCEWTTRSVGGRLAALLDGVVFVVPVGSMPLCQGELGLPVVEPFAAIVSGGPLQAPVTVL